METGSYDQWIGCDAYGTDGEKIGEIKDIYYDDVSGRPEWVSVKAGLFKGERLVPIAGARMEERDDGSCLVLNYDKNVVGDAPHMDDDGHLMPDQERELYSYYGFDWQGTMSNQWGYGQSYDDSRFDKDYSRREVGAIGDIGTDRGTVEAEATISNQDVNVTEQTEKVRLRKYQRTEMVPVTKEEVRVERVSDEQRQDRR
jgi:hypothetical protein